MLLACSVGGLRTAETWDNNVPEAKQWGEALMNEYRSLDEISADERLGIGKVESLEEAESALHAALLEVQAASDGKTPERYYLLVGALQSVHAMSQHPGSIARRKGAEIQLADVATRALEAMEQSTKAIVETNRELLEALKKPPPSPVAASPEQRLAAQQRVFVTKASKDYTRVRTVPFVVFGAAFVAVWAVRGAFGVDVKNGQIISSSPIWTIGLVSLLLLLAGLWLVSRREQARDERILRALFDPDVQSDAVALASELYLGAPFRLADYRDLLRATAAERRYRRSSRQDRRWIMHDEEEFGSRDRRDFIGALVHDGERLTARTWSTVGIDDASDEAAAIALERLIESEFVEAVAGERGRTLYQLRR
jgi:hypothetical protein